MIKDRIANTLWKTLDDLEQAIGEELRPIYENAEECGGWFHTLGSLNKQTLP